MLEEKEEFRQALAVFKAETRVLALLVLSEGYERKVCSRPLSSESQAITLYLSHRFPSMCISVPRFSLFIRTLVILDEGPF